MAVSLGESNAPGTALSLLPENAHLKGMIQDLLQGDMTQEIPEDKCNHFKRHPQSPQYACGLYISPGEPCGETFDRSDRFKHHVQGHLGITPYSCATSKKVPQGQKWCVCCLEPMFIFPTPLPALACSQALQQDTHTLTTR
jgi:hypothetical protein